MRIATPRAWLPAFVILHAAVAGCGNPLPPTAAPPADRPAATAEDPRAEGDARFKRGDYSGAAQAYEQALLGDPQSLAIRYLLGAALAQADRVQEAMAAFLWVVDHGSADREEVRLARQWLAEARVVLTAPAPAVDAAPAPALGEAGGAGQVTGRTQWTNEHRRLKLVIVLHGDDTATRGRRYATNVTLNEPYEIAGVVPGRYRVMARVGPIRLWDTSVDVKAKVPTVLDLTPPTSIAPSDALRLRG
jgi:hypothetical protein